MPRETLARSHRNRHRARAAAAIVLWFAPIALATVGARAQSEVLPDHSSQRVLEQRIEKLVKESPLKEGLSLSVVNLATGRQVVGHQAAKAQNPASNMKLVTAAVALSELGADFQMQTGLYGKVEGDAVVGGLYLRGYGDPTLSSEDLMELARQLMTRGIRKVDEVVVDGSYFDDQVLPPAFDQQPEEVSPFRAAIAAVSVNRAAYTMALRPGAEVGKPARVELDAAGYFDLDNQLTTSDGGSPTVVAIQKPEEDKLKLLLRGKLALGSGRVSYRRRVESPLHHAGYALVEALKSYKLQVPWRVRLARAPNGLPLLAQHDSPPLSILLYPLGKHSDNFVAEMLLKVIGAERAGQPGTSAAGARVAKETLAKLGVPTTSLEIVNGSGLFEGNHVSALHLTKLLTAMWNDPALRPEYLAQLAVGGVDGTLSNRLEQLPAPRVVRAKTGTLADVIALSGYVLGPAPDRAFAFSVLLNGVRGQHHAARELADRIASEIALHLWAK